MKKANIKKKSPAVKATVTAHLAVRPPAGKPVLSAALPTVADVAKAYASPPPRPKRVNDEPKGRAYKLVNLATKTAPAHKVKDETLEAGREVMRIAPVNVGPPPPAGRPIVEALIGAGFKYAGHVESDPVTGRIAWGFTHPKGRAALYLAMDEAGLKRESWAVITGGVQQVGAGLDRLNVELKVHRTPYKAQIAFDRQQRTLAKNRARMERLIAAEEQLRADAAKLPPQPVVDAVRLLDKATVGKFNLRRLVGDKNYATRLHLLKTLTGKTRILVEDAAVAKVLDAFHKVMKPKGKTMAEFDKDFVNRCKELVTTAKSVYGRTRGMEKRKKQNHDRLTVEERTVPGPVPLPGYKKPTRAEREAAQALAKEQLTIAATTDEGRRQPVQESLKADMGYYQLALVEGNETLVPKALPHLYADDILLLENTKDCKVMLRLECANSQGAVCCYNNSRQIAVGLVSPETLEHFRKIEGADIISAAHQLLHPIVPGVEVTSVAVNHLTAVLNNEEIQMAVKKTGKTANKTAAVSVAKSPKYAATVAAAKSTEKAKTTKAATTKSATVDGRSSYAGKKIKVLNKNHGARLGTKRQIGMDIILKSKTTDEAIPLLAKAGCNNSFLAFAVKEGFVSIA